MYLCSDESKLIIINTIPILNKQKTRRTLLFSRVYHSDMHASNSSLFNMFELWRAGKDCGRLATRIYTYHILPLYRSLDS